MTNNFLRVTENITKNRANSFVKNRPQFVMFKPLGYCFEEMIGFDGKVLVPRRLVSHLFKPGDITKEC